MSRCSKKSFQLESCTAGAVAPMPDWSKGRGQVKSDPLSLQVQVGVQGYQPCPIKTKIIMETKSTLIIFDTM